MTFKGPLQPKLFYDPIFYAKSLFPDAELLLENPGCSWRCLPSNSLSCQHVHEDLLVTDL